MNILASCLWKPITFLTLACSVSWIIYHAGYQASDSVWQVRWEKRNSTDLAEKIRNEQQDRAEEQRRQKITDGERERAETELVKAKGDAADADAAGKRLQRNLTEFKKRLAESEAGRVSALATASETRKEIGVLLAQLLSESDKAAGEYAAEADRNYAAGQSCERTYDAVTN